MCKKDVLKDELVCFCHGITRSSIVEKIKSQRIYDLDDLVEETSAGNSCGGCLIDVEDILTEINGDDIEL